MQNIKINRLIWIIPCFLLSVSSMFITSCDEDDITGSVVAMPDYDLWDTTAIGNYIYENYTKPFNIRVIYRWEDNRQDMGVNLVPPQKDKVIPFLSMLKRVWLDTYVQITANNSTPNFMRTYVPKEIILTGSKALNTDGSTTLGFAEAGRQIQLYSVNNLSVDDHDAFVMFFHTIHHEFAHILQQTNKDYDTEFRVLSKGKYTSTWINSTNDKAREEGFITKYAKSEVDEDFVEMLSIRLVNSPEAWNYLIDKIESKEAREILREKERIMCEWMRDVWEIDMDEFQQLVYKTIAKEMGLPENVDLIHDGNVIIGKVVNSKYVYEGDFLVGKYVDGTFVPNGGNEYRQLLTSSAKGWRLDYCPNELEYGYFPFLLNYDEAGTVEILSDQSVFNSYAEGLPEYKSEKVKYTIQDDTYPILNLPFSSMIAKIGNEDEDSEIPLSLTLIGHSLDEDTVYLKTENNTICYMVRNEADWDGYFTNLNNVLSSFDCADVANTYFRDILINGGQNVAVMTNFNVDTRMATILHYDAQGTLMTDNSPLQFADDRILFTKPITVGDIVIKEFVSDNSGTFLVNGDASSLVKVAENGRPQISFKVKDKLFLGKTPILQGGYYEDGYDSYYMERSQGAVNNGKWDELLSKFKNLKFSVLLSDDAGVYSISFQDHYTSESGDSVFINCQSTITHQWSAAVDDEITFRGAGRLSCYEFNQSTNEGKSTERSENFKSEIQELYTTCIEGLFGANRNRITYVVVPSSKGNIFTFVNKSNGDYFVVRKVYMN